MQTTIKQIFQTPNDYADQPVILQGWIRNHRAQKEFGFINLNDGTFFENIQVVYGVDKVANFDEISHINIGAAIQVEGTLILTPTMKQPFEVVATTITILGDSDETYPIQAKRHTREFLREKAHLRPRTNLFSAVFRVRSLAAMAIHSFFQARGFIYVNTPIITALDGEGAGEMFNVTTLNLEKLPKDDQGQIDYTKDFFGKKTALTVTGQLEAESFAMAFRNVYTFGPTFRAENSNTQRHASEFWMIEPEIAFADLNDNMALAEDFIKYIIADILAKAPEEMKFFDQFVQPGLLNRLKTIGQKPFTKVTHQEAIDILLKANIKFENKPRHGKDLATEHEKYLTDTYFSTPVFVTDWPKDIKAFYMRLNDDNETVAAMDLLVPGAGELIGGSQREERINILAARMKEMHIHKEGLEWYLELRQYGGCLHAGFGLGFERLIMYLTGVENIRDVIPFPRTPKHCDF